MTRTEIATICASLAITVIAVVVTVAPAGDTRNLPTVVQSPSPSLRATQLPSSTATPPAASVPATPLPQADGPDPDVEFRAAVERIIREAEERRAQARAAREKMTTPELLAEIADMFDAIQEQLGDISSRLDDLESKHR